MKTILAIWNSGGKGKTSSIRELAKLLISTYPKFVSINPKPIIITLGGDISFIIEIDGIRIGIESQGDPNTKLEGRMKRLASEYACDIIICATRTRGDTLKAVERVADEYDYAVIWTSTYQVGKAYEHTANQLKAMHLLDLLQFLGLLPTAMVNAPEASQQASLLN